MKRPHDPARFLPSRRTLLVGGGAAAGLVLAWSLWPRDYALNLNAAPGETILGAWLKIGRDGHVTMVVPQCEYGQGVTTALPQIMADELGADWRTVAVEAAPVNAAYVNQVLADPARAPAFAGPPLPGVLGDVQGWVAHENALRGAAMLTGGSSSIRAFEGPCRDAAAAARAMLAMAAAERWGVEWESCRAEAGFIVHGKRRLRFAELATDAATMTPPATPVYRGDVADPLYGSDLVRLDLPAKVDGTATYAADVRVPGLLYAAIRQGPHGDTRVTGLNRRAAETVPGMVRIVEHDRWVATVARNWWAANRALDRLAPVFSTDGPLVDSDGIDRALRAALAGDGDERMAAVGDAAGSMAGRKLVEATFAVSPAQHAAIETRSATAAPDGSRLRVWVATQAPAACRAAVAAACGMAESRVTLFPTLSGGSFGAALNHDVAVQAALIARAIDGPVQLTWSRAEDIIRDLPRAPARAIMRAAIGPAGRIDALHARIAAPASGIELRARLFDGATPHAAMAGAGGTADPSAVGGALPPYRIPNVAVDHVPVTTGLPAGYWRGAADSYTAFFTECFVDELAAAAGFDPLSFRMAMLGGAPELARCLSGVATLGGWEGGVAGSAQGLACHSLRGSHIAVMAVARQGEGGLQVPRMFAVVDAGRIVNPAIARQQIEGGLIFGLAAAVGATSDYRAGMATARKLAQLGLPRLAQSPDIIVEFIDSDRDPGGMSEIAVPLAAPAIANALASSTGRRIRTLPLAGDRP